MLKTIFNYTSSKSKYATRMLQSVAASEDWRRPCFILNYLSWIFIFFTCIFKSVQFGCLLFSSLIVQFCFLVGVFKRTLSLCKIFIIYTLLRHNVLMIFIQHVVYWYVVGGSSWLWTNMAGAARLAHQPDTNWAISKIRLSSWQIIK